MSSMILSVLALVASALVAAALAVMARVILRTSDQRGPLEDPAVSLDDLERLERRIDALRLAVSDGIDRVIRADKRIEKTVASARRLVAGAGLEHPGLEAEAEELRALDDGRSPALELFDVREDVAADGPTGMPGVSQADLETLRQRQAG